MTAEANAANGGVGRHENPIDDDSVLTDHVVHETIDGETVVIDLASGSYFSLEGSAALAWERLVLGEDVGATAHVLADRYGAEERAAFTALLALHHELHAAGLLRDRPNAIAPAAGTTFTMPAMVRYDDMREHLLVDPIHEVERGEGWPAPPAE